MIPAIKESNQLKAFLGIKEHMPEYYNSNMDDVNRKSVKGSENQFFSLQEFTIPPAAEEAPPTTLGEAPKPN